MQTLPFCIRPFLPIFSSISIKSGKGCQFLTPKQHIVVGCHPSFEKFDGVLCPAGQGQRVSHIKMTSRIVGSEGEAPLQFRNRLLTLTPKEIHSRFGEVINSAYRCLLRVLDRPRTSLKHPSSWFLLRSKRTRDKNTRRPCAPPQEGKITKSHTIPISLGLQGKKTAVAPIISWLRTLIP